MREILTATGRVDMQAMMAAKRRAMREADNLRQVARMNTLLDEMSQLDPDSREYDGKRGVYYWLCDEILKPRGVVLALDPETGRLYIRPAIVPVLS